MREPRQQVDRGYVLHARPYRETSQLLEVFTELHGRVGLVARGARRRNYRWRAALQPFQAARLAWTGRSSLQTLTDAEPETGQPRLVGNALLPAFYLNELVMHFVTRGDPHPGLFAEYARALGGLAAGGGAEAVLRGFELALLAEVGYAVNLRLDATTDEPLVPEQAYEYVVEHGPVPVPAGREGPRIFSGAQLLGIAEADFGDAATLEAAKRLLRLVLGFYLAGKPLKTREVFRALRG